jgi:hypothetical protein
MTLSIQSSGSHTGPAGNFYKFTTNPQQPELTWAFKTLLNTDPSTLGEYDSVEMSSNRAIFALLRAEISQEVALREQQQLSGTTENNEAPSFSFGSGWYALTGALSEHFISLFRQYHELPVPTLSDAPLLLMEPDVEVTEQLIGTAVASQGKSLKDAEEFCLYLPGFLGKLENAGL